MLKNQENNGTEEIGLVTPTPDLCWQNISLAQWLGYCACNRGVVGSSPDREGNIFHFVKFR